MNTGMTLKQMAIARLLKNVQAYKEAMTILRDPFHTFFSEKQAKSVIVYASIAIHSLKGQVPRGYKRMATWKALTT